jgi:hypothetical protein
MDLLGLIFQCLGTRTELASRALQAGQNSPQTLNPNPSTLKNPGFPTAGTRTELADVRFKLGHEQLVAHEAKRQQCLGAADAKNFRRYIKSARDKEANFKADAARYGSRK